MQQLFQNNILMNSQRIDSSYHITIWLQRDAYLEGVFDANVLSRCERSLVPRKLPPLHQSVTSALLPTEPFTAFYNPPATQAWM